MKIPVFEISQCVLFHCDAFVQGTDGLAYTGKRVAAQKQREKSTENNQGCLVPSIWLVYKLWRHGIHYNDNQHNDIKHTDIWCAQHYIQDNCLEHNDTQKNDTQRNNTENNDIQINDTQQLDNQNNYSQS